MNNLPFSNAFETAWNEWLQYRKERKLPKYTPTGLKRTLTHLVNISGDNEQTAVLIIDQSIVQNYQGLFPLKNNYANNTANTNKNLGSAAGATLLLNKLKQQLNS